MLWKSCVQYASKFGNLNSGNRTWKGQFSFQSPKGYAEKFSNCNTIALISHTIKILLKNLQARFQQYINREPPDVQAAFRKGRGTRDQLTIFTGSLKKQEISRKIIFFCITDYAKAFDCVDHHKLWRFFKRWEYQTTWPASWEICMQDKK